MACVDVSVLKMSFASDHVGATRKQKNSFGFGFGKNCPKSCIRPENEPVLFRLSNWTLSLIIRKEKTMVWALYGMQSAVW